MEIKSYIKHGVNVLELTKANVDELTKKGVVFHSPETGYMYIHRYINTLTNESIDVGKTPFQIGDFLVQERDKDALGDFVRVFGKYQLSSYYSPEEYAKV